MNNGMIIVIGLGVAAYMMSKSSAKSSAKGGQKLDTGLPLPLKAQKFAKPGDKVISVFKSNEDYTFWNVLGSDGKRFLWQIGPGDPATRIDYWVKLGNDPDGLVVDK